jgi:hypothetical protein
MSMQIRYTHPERFILQKALRSYKFHCMSVQYDKYIYYNQHYAHDWGG